MASFMNTTYPPDIDTFMPAFIASGPLKVYFSYSKYNSGNISKMNVHYTLVDQQTNKNVLRDPTGIGIVLSESYSGQVDGYQKVQYDADRGAYYFFISPDTITTNNQVVNGDIEKFKHNQYYQLQIRFDDNENIIADMGDNRYAYMHSYSNQYNHFSEWSKVCLIRPILQPFITLTKFSEDESEQVVKNNQPTFTKGIIPIRGRMRFGTKRENELDIRDRETETLQYYWVIVRDSVTEEELFHSENIYTGDQSDMNELYYDIDSQGFNDEEDVTSYILEIGYITRNNYRGSQRWWFKVAEYITMPDFNPRITVCIDNDEGVADIHVTNDKTLFGILHIKRSDSRSKFKIWEDFKVCIIGIDKSDSPGKLDMHIYDDTVSSLLWYQYSVQLENEYHGFSQLYLSDDVIMPEFYDMFLKRLDKRVPIRYNYKINSFKPVVNRVKFDTLGGKYPKFAENASMNYKQFTVTGLISAQADEQMAFLNKKEWFGTGIRDQYDDYLLYKTYNPVTWYDNKGEDGTLITNRTMRDRIDAMYGLDDLAPGCILPGWPDSDRYSKDDNYDFMWERIYREELVAWLNDGEPKLYRSMTEGNMCVMITDISLTPNATLGRRIWDFSATMYEVDDGYSLRSLYDLGIIDKYTDIARCLVGDDHVTTDCVTKYGVDYKSLLNNPYVSVVKPGQVYLYKDYNDDSDDIIETKIYPDLKYRYSGSWGSLVPEHARLTDVKIFFHSKPHVYIQSSGTRNGDSLELKESGAFMNNLISSYHDGLSFPFDTTDNDPWYDKEHKRSDVDVLSNAYSLNNEDPSQKERYVLGYRIGVKWANSNSFQQIFVPYRRDSMIHYRRRSDVWSTGDISATSGKPILGSYFIPSDMEVLALYLPDDKESRIPQDEVTVEYVIRYEEHNNSDSMTIENIEQEDRVVGQYGRSFAYGDTLANDINERYFIVEDIDDVSRTTREMQFWYGICIEAEPYSLVRIKYYGDSKWNDLMVGDTGVLHLLKDEKLDDVMFVGKQMFEAHPGAESLREWEYKLSGERFDKLEDIQNPAINNVYEIANGETYIFYHNKFYTFEHEPETSNGPMDEMGIVHAPVYGQVEYMADILKVRRRISTEQVPFYEGGD